MKKSCISCSLFVKCKDKKKGLGYFCDKYTKQEYDMSFLEDAAGTFSPAKKATRKERELSEEETTKGSRKERREIRQFVEDLESGRVDNVDTKIDDRDFPLARNFFDFCASGKYLAKGFAPFAKQIESAIWLLSDFCPECSNMSYAKDIPKDADYDDIKKKIKFFVYGVCPKCGMTRSKAWRKGYYKMYSTAAGMVGQRCIAAGSMVLTDQGFKRIETLCPAKVSTVPYTASANLILENGELCYPSHAMKVKEERLYHAVLSNGITIHGTKDHPIMTNKGWKKLVELNDPGTQVPVIHGLNKWGTDDLKLIHSKFPVSDKLSVEQKQVLVARAAAHVFYTNIEANHKMFDDMALKFSMGPASRMTIDVFSQLGLRVEHDAEKDEIVVHTSDNMHNLGFMTLSGNQLNKYGRVKYVPNCILGAKKHLVETFLREAFNICYIRTRDRKGRRNSFKFRTRQQAHDVQILAINLGLAVTHTKSVIRVGEKYRAQFDAFMEGRDYTIEPFAIDCDVKVAQDSAPAPSYDFTIPKFHRFMANGILNHNSGKSIWSSMIAGYSVHRTLKMPNPAMLYGLLPNQTLQATFTATLFRTAKANIYKPFHDLVLDSPWFKGYHDMLDSISNKRGQELYTFKDTLFHYKHKRISGYVASPDQRTLRGDTRFLAVIDEIGHMYSKTADGVRMNAKEVFLSLRRSMLTLSNAAYMLHRKKGNEDVPQPLLLAISSPSSIHDMISSLYEESKQENSDIYGFHYSTLQFNPNMTKRILMKEAGDYATYARDYLAKPPLSANAFISKKKALLNSVDDTQDNIIELEQEITHTATGIRVTSANLRINCKSNYVKSSPKWLTLDAGKTRNSFGGTLWYIKEGENEDGEKYQSPAVCGMFEVVPEVNAPINFTMIYDNVIAEICRELNVKGVTIDQWQSEKIITDLESDFEIETIVHSPKYMDFLLARQKLYDGEIPLPEPEMSIKDALNLTRKEDSYPLNMTGFPVSHFMAQCLTVVDVKGKTVDKAEGMTDDIFRAFILGVSSLSNPIIMEILTDGPPPPPTKRVLDVGIALGSGGAGGGGSGGVEGAKRFIGYTSFTGK